MPQVKYTPDGLPYYDATDQQTQPYFPQMSGPMLPAPGNPAQPSEGWNQGVRDTLHGMTIGPVQDAAKALQGGMTGNEAQDFAFGAALGLLPMGRGLRPAQGIRAYHGSPHDFDRFDMSKIGTGEGAQAYGHGLYFADNPNVAETYRSKLAALHGTGKPQIDGRPLNWDDPIETAAFELMRHNGDRAAAAEFFERTFSRGSNVPEILRSGQPLPTVKPAGHMYEVNINAHPDQFLDWDKPLSKQPADVRQPLGKVLPPGLDNMRGEQLYRTDLPYHLGVPKPEVSSALREAGIPGLKYLDQGSRTAGEGSRNYVVFDDKLISIIKKYGWAAIAPMLGLSAENLPIPKAQAPQFQ